MKKLLLLGAVTLLGSIGTNSWAYDAQVRVPVTSLTNGGTYYIYDAHGDDGSYNEIANADENRYAFRKVNTDNGNVIGTHIKPYNAPQLDNSHVWVATTTDDGATWSFRNVATNKYMKTDNYASDQGGQLTTTDVETEIAKYVLEQKSDPVNFTIKVDGTNNCRWDGISGSSAMVYWGGDGHTYNFDVALANDDATAYSFETVNQGWNVTYTYPAYPGCAAISKTIAIQDGKNAAGFIPSLDFFTPTGLTVSGDDAIVRDGQVNFTVTGTWNIPFDFNTVYHLRIKPNNRETKNIKLDGTQVLSHYDGEVSDIAATCWYFKFNSMNNDGQLIVTMHSLAAPDSKGLSFGTGDNSKATLADAATPLALVATTWSSKQSGDFCLKHHTANNWINDRNPYFSTWNSADAKGNDGSVIRLIALTDDDVDTMADYNSPDAIEAAKTAGYSIETMRALANNRLDESNFNAYKATGEAFIALGMSSGEALNDWNAKASVTNKSQSASEALERALHTLVESASLTADNVSLQFRHPQRENVYMGLTDQGVKRGSATETEGTRAFTLKVAEGGFNIYHEYTNSYIKHPTGLNYNISMVSNAADASVYTLELRNSVTGLIGIKTTTTLSEHGNSCGYLHCNKGGNDKTNVVAWSAGDNSAWYLSAVSEEAAAAENYQGAKAYYNGLSRTPGVGNYNVTASNKSIAETTIANGDAADATAETHRASANVLFGITSELNMPVAGHFYRFKSSANGKYISTGVDSNGRIELVANATGVNETKTVFYLEAVGESGQRLVAFPSGLVMGQFMDSRTDTGRKSWGLHEPSETFGENVNKVTNNFSATSCGAHAEYNIFASDGRRLYGGAPRKDQDRDVLDCGGNDGAGYRFVIEEVTWIPVPVTATTLNVPVELKLATSQRGAGRVKAYTAVQNGNKLEKTRVEGDLPANTPVILQYVQGAVNDCAFLEVNYDGTMPAIENNALKGLTAASATLENALCIDSESKKFIPAGENAIVDGFSAYVTVEEGTEELVVTLPEHINMLNDAKFAFESTKHSITLSHPSHALSANLDVTESITLSVVQASTTAPEGVAPRRIAAENGVYTIGHDNVSYTEAGDAVINFEEQIPAGNYTLNVPAGFFLLSKDGEATHVSKSLTNSVTMNANGTTGIEEITVEGNGANGAIYDLQGRRLSAPVKGINIINGKKVLVK